MSAKRTVAVVGNPYELAVNTLSYEPQLCFLRTQVTSRKINGGKVNQYM